MARSPSPATSVTSDAIQRPAVFLQKASRAVKLASPLLENARHKDESPCGLSLVVPEVNDNSVTRKSDDAPYELDTIGLRTQHFVHRAEISRPYEREHNPAHKCCKHDGLSAVPCLQL
jgi:hypothetical protein